MTIKYPFDVYRIETQVNEVYAEYSNLCESCGQPCGHSADSPRVKRAIGMVHNVVEYTVIGGNDTEYFVRLIHEDYAGSESINTIPIADTYLSEVVASAEANRLANVAAMIWRPNGN